MSGKSNGAAAIAGLLLAASALAVTPARADTFTVNSTVDAPATATALASGLCADATGACTLRAAIQVADLATTPSTIDVPAGIYSLSVGGVDESYAPAPGSVGFAVVHDPDAAIGDLNITRSMTIAGAGAAQTVIGWTIPAADRVFHIEAVDQNITVTLEGLTVQDGVVPDPVILDDSNPDAVVEFVRYGGGIAAGTGAGVVVVNPNAEHGGGGGGGGGGDDGGGESGYVIDGFILNDVHVLDNYAGSDGGGLYSAAPLTLEDSIVSGNVSGAGNGGGLYSDAQLTMIRTTIGAMAGNPMFSANSAENGGGIFETGSHDSRIEESAITGNLAVGGAGIAGRRLVLENIVNSTIAGNLAEDTGGGISTNGRVILSSSTIADNRIASDAEGGGAGLNGFGPAGGGGNPNFTLVNSIVSNNTIAATPAVIANCGGTGEGDDQARFKSRGYNLEDADTCGLDATGDLTDTDPLLELLAMNGGPTETMALPQSSPAVDAGTNAGCPNNDQRGSLRPADGNLDGSFICDIGAFELYIPSADLHINDMTAPDEAYVGDPFDVTVNVHIDPNATAPSENVVFTTDALPPELAVNSASVTTPTGTSSCTVASGVVTCYAGTLDPDAVAMVTMNLAATSPAGQLPVTAHVTQSSPPDPDLTNNTASVNFAAIGLSDLAVSASGTADPVDVGSETDIPFTVANSGPHGATGLSVGIAIPAGVSYRSVSLASANCDASDPTAVLCTMATLPAGGSASGTLRVAGASEGPADVEFGTYATQRDDNPANDTAVVALSIQGLNDLALSGGFSAGQARTGTQVALTLQIANKGPTDATHTMVITSLPGGLGFASAAGATCTASGGSVSCDLGTLAAGQTAGLSLNVTVEATSGVLKATSSVSSDKTDPDLSNNSVTTSLSVITVSGGGGGGGGGGAFGPAGLLLLAAAAILAALHNRRRASMVKR